MDRLVTGFSLKRILGKGYQVLQSKIAIVPAHCGAKAWARAPRTG